MIKNDKISINEFIKEFHTGEYDTYDIKKLIRAGWWDWFCNDKSLRERLKPLGKFLVSIKECKLIDPEYMYVYFRNIAPVYGPTFDCFGISHLDDEIDIHLWVGFIRKGCYGRDSSSVEICMTDLLINQIKNNIIIDLKDKGTFKNPLVFDDRKQAKRFLLGI